MPLGVEERELSFLEREGGSQLQRLCTVIAGYRAFYELQVQVDRCSVQPGSPPNSASVSSCASASTCSYRQYSICTQAKPNMNGQRMPGETPVTPNRTHRPKGATLELVTCSASSRLSLSLCTMSLVSSA